MLLLNSKVRYGAGDGSRTRDLLLGKQTLYEMRHKHHYPLSLVAVACNTLIFCISCLTQVFQPLLEHFSAEQRR